MNRRTFGKLLAAIGLGGGVAAGGGAREFYSVERGHRGRAFLDGREVPYVISCKTGDRGWVRRYKLKDGRPYLHRGDVPTIRERGCVTFILEARRGR